MRIICDFDGTITLRDTTDAVLEALADPAWRTIEAEWIAGRIAAAECMRQQIALVDAADRQIDALLDTLDLDPGFPAFVAFCESQLLPLEIVSDGVDYFINRILCRHGLERLPVTANRLAGHWPHRRLEQPWSRPGCAAGSGVCKCAAALEPPGTLVFIGDGRSDFCLSAKADILFAKGELARYAEARGQAFHEFDSFNDVTRVMTDLISTERPTARRAVTA